jgi:hypothetical protein
MSSGDQFSADDAYQSECRRSPRAEALVGLLISLVVALFLAFLFSDPALRVFALLGFVILLVAIVARFGFLVALLGVGINVPVLTYVLRDPAEAYNWLLQFLREVLSMAQAVS